MVRWKLMRCTRSRMLRAMPKPQARCVMPRQGARCATRLKNWANFWAQAKSISRSKCQRRGGRRCGEGYARVFRRIDTCTVDWHGLDARRAFAKKRNRSDEFRQNGQDGFFNFAVCPFLYLSGVGV